MFRTKIIQITKIRNVSWEQDVEYNLKGVLLTNTSLQKAQIFV